MIVKKHIVETLNNLDYHYNEAMNSTSSKSEPQYFAKLAVLEYCGWIEEAQDLIIHRSIKGKLTTPPFKQKLDSYVERNYGFQYKKNFQTTLCRVAGLVITEKVDIYLENKAYLDIFKSELDTITTQRNQAAHTYNQASKHTYPAPSIINRQFNILCPILKDIYSEVIRIT